MQRGLCQPPPAEWVTTQARAAGKVLGHLAEYLATSYPQSGADIMAPSLRSALGSLFRGPHADPPQARPRTIDHDDLLLSYRIGSELEAVSVKMFLPVNRHSSMS
jgi:hypothetical protein